MVRTRRERAHERRVASGVTGRVECDSLGVTTAGWFGGAGGNEHNIAPTHGFGEVRARTAAAAVTAFITTRIARRMSLRNYEPHDAPA